MGRAVMPPETNQGAEQVELWDPIDVPEIERIGFLSESTFSGIPAPIVNPRLRDVQVDARDSAGVQASHVADDVLHHVLAHDSQLP